MRTHRLVVNLVAFLLVSLALIAYGVVDLLGDPLESPMTVSAVFPDASGIYTNFSVELNGVDVGTVSAVSLAKDGARVVMAIDHGTVVPGDVVASIGIANDLGEQVVELTPTHGGRAKPLRAGAVVPVEPGGIPASVGKVVAAATTLLRAIPAGRLDQLLSELATSLQNRAGDLRTIISAGTTFAKEFQQYEHQFDALLANAPPVLDAVASVGPQLQQALVNTESLVQVLATHRSGVTGVLDEGSQAAGLLNGLLDDQGPDLACLIHDVAGLATNLAQPANLANLSQSLATNQYFFGAVNAVAVTGTAKALTTKQKDDPNQIFLRTRLLLPQKSPAGDAYPAQQGLPAVKPGAACTTELGKGVAAASQPGFTPADGGTLDQPTAAEAVVRGGGDGSAPAQPSSFSQRLPAGSNPLPLVVAGVVVLPGLLLAWGARPARRRRRRRA